MAKVPRPPKARGNRNYHGEVLAGKPDVLDTEIDADFDTIYTTVNGQIIDENIQAGAAIDYSKLNLTGRIKPSDLISGFLLPTGSIPPNAVDTPQIKDGAVTKLKIAPGNSLFSPPQLAPHGASGPTTTPFGELVLCTIVYTPRSYTYLQGYITGSLQIAASGSTLGTLSLILRDGGPPGANLVAQTDLPIILSQPGTPVLPYALYAFGNSLAAGPYTLAITATASSSVNVTSSNSKLVLIEPS